MDNLFGNNFIDMIKYAIPNAKIVSGGSEMLVRCPFCGDSKNLSHAHMYIKVPQGHDEISFYSCKKCPSMGIVDDDLLRKFGCIDSNILVQLNKHNSEVMKLPKYKTLKSINIYPLNNHYIRRNDISKYKLNYINNRIGSNFDYEDLSKLKILLNLYDILNSNNLELTRHKMIGDDLDKFFIGFISYDNSFANMRKITNKELYKSVNKRYINYNLVNKLDTRKNFYIIPTEVDVMSDMPIKIHIAEGPFDILSIYYNLNNCNGNQNIYMSCGGKESYLNSLEFILSELGIINFELHYYPDIDVSDYEFNYVLRTVYGLNCDIFLHRNVYEGEKDFGVPIDRIKEYIRKVN